MEITAYFPELTALPSYIWRLGRDHLRVGVWFAFYQQPHLEIHSPDGECLAHIGEELTRIAEDDASYQLWEQACLLEALLDQIQEDVKLPQRAITGLADMMGRINTHFLKSR